MLYLVQIFTWATWGSQMAPITAFGEVNDENVSIGETRSTSDVRVLSDRSKSNSLVLSSKISDKPTNISLKGRISKFRIIFHYKYYLWFKFVRSNYRISASKKGILIFWQKLSGIISLTIREAIKCHVSARDNVSDELHSKVRQLVARRWWINPYVL